MTSASPGQLQVAVGIAPLAYFLEQIGGDRVKVEVVLSAGQSPVTYDPTARQLARLGEADVYFQVGVPFERQLADKMGSAFPDLQIVPLRPANAGQSVTAAAADSDDEQDPHYWLDPRLMIEVADMICSRLIKESPRDSSLFAANLSKLTSRLTSLDSSIAARLEPYRGRELWVFHPAFGYFAEAYGLKQVALEHEGKEPNVKLLAALADEAKDKGVGAIFVQPQFSTQLAQTFADEVGARIVSLDPLAADYVDNLLQMAEKIAAAMSH